MPQRRRQARRLQRESCRVAHPISILHIKIIRNIVAGDTAVVNRGENDYISKGTTNQPHSSKNRK